MKNTIMMQTPILRTKKFLEKKESFPILPNLPEQQNLFLTPPSLQKKEGGKKTEKKPRGYKSLHSSEYVELTQSYPR